MLTHPYLLAAFAHTTATSPIHRGVLLARGVLGLTLHPPPEAFTPLPESLHPDFTTRERVALQTKGESCQSCHGVINPLGFTLEHFDAVGRYRDQDNGKPIDATGAYKTRGGETVKFDGAATAGGVPGRQRGGADGVRGAAVPPPGQAAGAGVRPAAGDGAAGVVRQERVQHQESAGGGGDGGGADGEGGEGAGGGKRATGWLNLTGLDCVA